MRHSAIYTLGFAAAICLVCSLMVTSSAVSLKERQDVNKLLYRKENVLLAAGLMKQDEDVSDEEIERRFETIRQVVVDLRTGEEMPDMEPADVDQLKMTSDPRTSIAVDRNLAQVQRVAHYAVVYKVQNESGQTEMLILPVEGKGLWSTLRGFLALSGDLQTIRGLAFYEHKETPGLGGEVDNPAWKALWPGRRAFDEDWNVEIEVIKGQAGPPAEDPYRVDGLSGATITARGVTHLIHFWLGEKGFGPYLENYRESRRAA